MAKQENFSKRINLLQPELVPPKERLTLGSMMSLWVIVLVGFLIAQSIVETLLLNEKGLNQALKNEQIELSAKTNLLQQKLAANKIDKALQSQLDATKLLLGDKTQLFQKLSAQEGELVDGFSLLMNELARYHHNQIMLESIYVNETNISIKGKATKAEFVPSWLSGFESSAFMKNKRFAGFKVSGQDEGVVFAVSTDPNVELLVSDAAEQSTAPQSVQGVQVNQGASNVGG